ncbi:hypothetical protein CRG98_021434 [Punica granatum]|uniref:Uncharacterized protein n=1 Tax=Punica granatum TaxID=22663 RepID=A0A2I0JRR0_PUNGR|nr:hypothetical protein CRG98_021434 [Punica granatum]
MEVHGWVPWEGAVSLLDLPMDVWTSSSSNTVGSRALTSFNVACVKGNARNLGKRGLMTSVAPRRTRGYLPRKRAERLLGPPEVADLLSRDSRCFP